MKCRIELHNAAQKELAEAFQWYEKRSPGLGVLFIEAVSVLNYKISSGFTPSIICDYYINFKLR